MATIHHTGDRTVIHHTGYTVHYGVRGASKVQVRDFGADYAAARAFAVRWSRSNSTGSYWSRINCGRVLSVASTLERFN